MVHCLLYLVPSPTPCAVYTHDTSTHRQWLDGGNPSVGRCVARSGSDMVTSFDATLNFLSMVHQLFYTTMLVVGEARRWQLLHAFNPNSKRAANSFCNMGLCLCLLMEYMAICAEEDVSGERTCFGETSRESLEGHSITFWMFGRVLQALCFAAETPGVALLCRVAFKTLPTLGPHLGIFFCMMYVYSGMGISFFCGLTTQAEEDDGPGYWGQQFVSAPDTNCIPQASSSRQRAALC